MIIYIYIYKLNFKHKILKILSWIFDCILLFWLKQLLFVFCLFIEIFLHSLSLRCEFIVPEDALTSS